MKNKPKLAFSLIELSVVILIIGILVIGVTKGKKVLDSARLASARSLTKNSPVNLNSENLGFWLETTSEKSFNVAEAVDGAAVSTWYDTKLSAFGSPVNVTASGTSRPLYIASATNGLPTLRFDGINDRMFNGSVAGSSMTKDGNQMTIFAVHKYYSPDHNTAIYFWGNGLATLHAKWGDAALDFDFGGCCSSATRIQFIPPSTFSNRTNIISAVRRTNASGAVRINGTQYGSAAASIMNATIDTSVIAGLEIGNQNGGLPAHIDINELIIFKTALTDNEIKDIEKYLSDKWGVPLTGL